MTVEWEGGLPFDGVCSTCRRPLVRGQRFHDCEGRGAELDAFHWRQIYRMRWIAIPTVGPTR